MTPADILIPYEVWSDEIGGHLLVVTPAHAIKAMKIYALLARIQERRLCIYNIEQDLLDNGPEGEGMYHEHYVRAMKDEIANHNAFMQDLEKELLTLTSPT
jgi:hypothetical protein